MKTDVQFGTEVNDLSTANELMIRYGRGFLPILSKDGILQTVVFKKDLDKHLRHPNESIDAKKRLLVGAAISTHPEDRDRVQALVEHEVDVLVIDASDGHTEYQRQMIEYVKSHSDTPVIGGNVVTAEGFRFLVEAGADAIKVGMGIGSGCTTQEVKATGRGQGTTLMEVGAMRDQWAEEKGIYIPLVADGGISGPAEMSVALALGANSLMMGNFFARYTESQGSLMRNAAGEIVKEYWMEGSMRAHNMRRYAQTKENFFEEGISGYVPHVGSIFDKLPTVIHMLSATLATAGCRSVDELHAKAVLEMQSPSALMDSQIHDIVPMNVDQQIL
jgi:IMP dehydrogenase